MPIPVECTCGWNRSVADKYAGKRAKCPDCGTVLTVPTPIIDYDATAAALLSDETPEVAGIRSKRTAEELEPARDGYGVDMVSKPTAIEFKPERTTKARKKKSARTGDRYAGPPRIFLSPGVSAALGSLLFGIVLICLALSNDRISIYGIILIIVGGFRLIRGLLGHSED